MATERCVHLRVREREIPGVVYGIRVAALRHATLEALAENLAYACVDVGHLLAVPCVLRETERLGGDVLLWGEPVPIPQVIAVHGGAAVAGAAAPRVPRGAALAQDLEGPSHLVGKLGPTDALGHEPLVPVPRLGHVAQLRRSLPLCGLQLRPEALPDCVPRGCGIIDVPGFHGLRVLHPAEDPPMRELLGRELLEALVERGHCLVATDHLQDLLQMAMGIHVRRRCLRRTAPQRPWQVRGRGPRLPHRGIADLCHGLGLAVAIALAIPPLAVPVAIEDLLSRRRLTASTTRAT
mmetsp:Transcript_48782/g.145748  ORF Transcript_48782/g.145748 Transcript_48782/m.145748 type:complete len:294 (+) Transcript_48782:651-1532(+)